MTARIAILDDYQNAALTLADWSVLKDRAAITVFNDHLEDEAAVIRRLQPFDIVCVMRERTPLPRSVIAALPNLRLIVSTGSRNASIDLAAAEARGIAVVNTGYVSTGVVELAWALLLALLRHVPEEAASLRAGGWQTRIGGDLAGRTLGLVGLGRSGAAMARIALAFGMRVIAWSQNLTPEKAAEHGAQWVEKRALFAGADIVSVHMVLSARTRGLIGAAELAAMKPDALLVNTSRGPIVDEAALIAALTEGRIAGAALDVFDREPLPPDHPFRRLPNCLATPHVGFVTRATYTVFYQDTVKAIDAFLGTPGN